MDLEEGGDEIDPLDAFMADNEAKVEPVKTEEDAAAAPQGIATAGGFGSLHVHTACKVQLVNVNARLAADTCHTLKYHQSTCGRNHCCAAGRCGIKTVIIGINLLLVSICTISSMICKAQSSASKHHMHHV